MQLGSSGAVAVVLAGGCSSDLTPSLGTSICSGCGPKKKKEKKKRKFFLVYFYLAVRTEVEWSGTFLRGTFLPLFFL